MKVSSEESTAAATEPPGKAPPKTLARSPPRWQAARLISRQTPRRTGCKPMQWYPNPPQRPPWRSLPRYLQISLLSPLRRCPPKQLLWSQIQNLLPKQSSSIEARLLHKPLPRCHLFACHVALNIIASFLAISCKLYFHEWSHKPSTPVSCVHVTHHPQAECHYYDSFLVS